MTFDINKPIFGRQKIAIPAEAKVVFVSDMFVEDYVGGAELTSQALIESTPFGLFKVHSKDVTMDLLSQGVDRFWIFGNFSSMDLDLIPSIVGNEMKYVVLEYDYKYCKYRSPEKHASIEGKPCDCHNEGHGKLISAFYYAASSLWWMSEKQQDRYFQMFPFLSARPNTVLSSVFNDDFFIRVRMLRDAAKDVERRGWIVLGSTSWVKGQDAAVQWCSDNGKEYEVVWNLPYDQLLEKMSRAEGFVYLPSGGDTCPRMVIEAKLLGCKLVLNDNVQHRDEEWFSTDDMEDTEAYLYLSRSRFWEGVKSNMNYNPKLSGYTTTYNAFSQEYPFVESVESMLQFCDEVCVVDGGSTDGTWESLLVLAADHPQLKVKQVNRDWSSPRFAVFDGLQKAEARKMCTGDFCWQQDSDEVVHASDAQKVRGLMDRFPPSAQMLALPVIEFWGGSDKVRIDVMPWKWRISRNSADITHGVPANLRRVDSQGGAYAAQGTDGCDMIFASSGAPVPFGTFYTPDVDRLRYAALRDEGARKFYEQWLNGVTSELPTIFHFSWWNLERKVKTYKNYWGRHWSSLYSDDPSKISDENMMFDKPWSEVTDDDIRERAALMKQLLGGWIWHSRWDGKTMTPHITTSRELPPSMTSWCERNR